MPHFWPRFLARCGDQYTSTKRLGTGHQDKANRPGFGQFFCKLLNFALLFLSTLFSRHFQPSRQVSFLAVKTALFFGRLLQSSKRTSFEPTPGGYLAVRASTSIVLQFISICSNFITIWYNYLLNILKVVTFPSYWPILGDFRHFPGPVDKSLHPATKELILAAFWWRYQSAKN